MQGSLVWTIDSGSECCVTSTDELTEVKSQRVFPLDRPIPLVTGNGATSAESAIDLARLDPEPSFGHWSSCIALGSCR